MTATAGTTGTAGTSSRLPAPVYVLALTVFCLGTSEFMIAGLLPDIASDLDVSVPAVGGLITAFAVGMLVGAPVMALLTLRLPRRVTLVAAALVFAAVHLVVLLTDSYTVILASRVVAAVACATFWAVGGVTVVSLAPSGSTARGLAVLVGGLTLSNIVGVPLGTWVGDQLGWRAAFVGVSAVTLAATLGTLLSVPETRAVVPGSLRSLAAREVRAMRNPRLGLALATTAAFQAAVFCCFSYLAPLLTGVSGLPAHLVPGVLLGFGVGSFVGITLGGRYADRNLMGNIFVSLGALALSLVALAAVSASTVGTVVAVVLFGLTGFSMASALNARVFVLADDAPTLGSAVNVSAFNVGNAVGPWLGGLVIGAGWGLVAPVWVALALVVLAFALATTSWRLEREPVGCREPAACAA